MTIKDRAPSSSKLQYGAIIGIVDEYATVVLEVCCKVTAQVRQPRHESLSGWQFSSRLLSNRSRH
jgi:hypothetical protein